MAILGDTQDVTFNTGVDIQGINCSIGNVSGITATQILDLQGGGYSDANVNPSNGLFFHNTGETSGFLPCIETRDGTANDNPRFWNSVTAEWFSDLFNNGGEMNWVVRCESSQNRSQRTSGGSFTMGWDAPTDPRPSGSPGRLLLVVGNTMNLTDGVVGDQGCEIILSGATNVGFDDVGADNYMNMGCVIAPSPDGTTFGDLTISVNGNVLGTFPSSQWINANSGGNRVGVQSGSSAGDNRVAFTHLAQGTSFTDNRSYDLTAASFRINVITDVLGITPIEVNVIQDVVDNAPIGSEIIFNVLDSTRSVLNITGGTFRNNGTSQFIVNPTGSEQVVTFIITKISTVEFHVTELKRTT